MPPNARSVAAVSEETGVATGTLYNWRTKYRNQGIAVPADDARPDKWTAQDKLAVVIETAALNQHALSEYCREKGLYTAQITEWRNAALHGYEKTEVTMAELKQHRKSDKRQIKRLERELNRKDKALAETAALLVLRKKAQAIWGESEDE